MARGRRSRRRAMENPRDASITTIEGLTRALNQQTTILSTPLGDSKRIPPVGQAATVAPRSDHQESEFVEFWLCHPPTFDGGLDHLSTATWLIEIEKILMPRDTPMSRA
ncbi:hypothetical protein SESBI_33166 [Sesbania bispinosa]|nr:hypothetical protein SESBI_33166 [Sesbania bispinosa]